MVKQDVEACIHAVKSGDTQAFEYIVDTYQKPIYKYIRYIVYNQWDSDDILQDVFIKIFTHLHTYKEGGNFEGWIYKIAYNQAINVLRKKKKNPVLDMTKMAEVAHFDEDKEELSLEVSKALQRLTAEERTLIFLRVHEDLSYKEISLILNKKEASLRKKYERAKHKFIKYYQGGTRNDYRQVQPIN